MDVSRLTHKQQDGWGQVPVRLGHVSPSEKKKKKEEEAAATEEKEEEEEDSPVEEGGGEWS